ncbi:MAG: hypothetical protein VW446_05810 [Alphaproteobacteria bacterium]
MGIVLFLALSRLGRLLSWPSAVYYLSVMFGRLLVALNPFASNKRWGHTTISGGAILVLAGVMKP